MLETNTQSFTVFFICSLGVFPNKNVQCICSRWAMNSWILLCQLKKNICFLRGSYSWANFSLVDLINVVPKKACFLMLVWNNVQTIGTIIWKHYPDTDDKRPGGTTNLDLSGRSGRSCKFWSDHAYGNALRRLTRTGRSKAIPESEVEAESWIMNH